MKSSSLSFCSSFLQVVQNGVSQAKFLGFNVSPHSVPILKKIWHKHGNIIQGHVLQNNGMISQALDSLANVILLLQSESGMSMNVAQAQYLDSTMCFLQGARFRLDWLFPFTQKAMAIHYGQQQIHYIKGLEMSKSVLVSQLHDLDYRLAEQTKFLVEKTVAEAPLVPINLKNVLG